MQPISIIEACCAIFILIFFIVQLLEKGKSKSQIIIDVLLGLTFVWLVVSCLGETLNKPSTNYYVVYFLKLFSMLFAPAIPFTFMLYCDAYFREKTNFPKWYFIPSCGIEAVNFVVFLIAFLTKKTWSYENGVFISAYRIPIISIILYACLGTYTLISIYLLRKKHGLRSAYIVALYLIPSIIGIVLVRNGIDATSICNGVASLLVILITNRYDFRRDRKSRGIAENNERILALSDNFESLYDVNLISLSYESYVKGETFSDYIDPKLENHNNFFSDSLINVKAVAYPDDIDGFSKIMDPEYIRNYLETSDHLDHYYRLIINGEPKWMRMRIVYKNSKKDHIIVGVFSAEQEMAAKKKDEELRKQLVEKMIGNDALFVINVETDTRITLHNETLDRNEYSDDDKFSTSIKKYINQSVIPFDRKKVREMTDLTYVLQKVNKEGEFSFRYRDTSSGAQRFFEIKFAKFSEKEVLMSVTQKDENILEELVFSKIKDEYFAIFVVDTDEGFVRILKNEPTELGIKAGEVYPYTDLMLKMSSGFKRDSKEREYFEKLSDTNYLKQKFANQDKSSFVFKVVNTSAKTYAATQEIVLTRHSSNNDPGFIAICFSYLDNEASENAVLQKRLSQDMSMIGGLAGEYHSMFYLNMDEDVFKTYKLPKNTSPKIKELLRKKIYGHEFLKVYGASEMVHPDDKSRFEKMDFEYLRSKLANQKKIVVRFRRKKEDSFDYVWYEMDIIKAEKANERANIVVIGFYECGEQVRKEQALSECFGLLSKNIQSFEAVNSVLKIMNEYYGGECTYICEIIKNKNTLDTTYEYIPEGSRSVSMKHKEFDVNVIQKWIDAISTEEPILINTKDPVMNSEPSMKFYEQMNIDNVMLCPMMNKGEIVGYIGIDNPTKSLNDLKSLKSASTIAYSEILKRKQNDEEHVTLEKVTASFICVFFCDLNRDYIHNWKTTRTHRDLFGDVSSYIGTLNHYVTDCIDPVDYERCYKMTRPENVIETFKTTDMFSIELVDTRFEKRYNVVLDYIKVSSDGTQFVICVRNITDTILKEKEHQQKLQEALQQADLANKSKTTFLFNMSHDIRTPMNAIQGFTDMAIKYIDNKEKALDCLKKTQQSGNMLLSLINSVLEVSRIESGHATLDCTPNDIFSSFTTIETTMKELADAKEIELTFDIFNIKNKYVMCDIARTLRILVNVISNAIKYTLNGGKVTVTCEQVGDAENGIGKYKYVVADNGIGMSEEFQKHVFEEFSREKTSTVSGIQGTGLGMAVVKSFVDLMNGTITCQSKKDVGTTFTIILPFKIQDEAEIQQESEKIVNEEIEAKISLQNKKVLLVDDNALNREIAAEILGDEEMVVETACDGLMAVNTVKEKGPSYYDFILMDIQMPIMDGYEATKEIRKAFPDANIPIIALSANAFAEDKQASINAGMNDHVAKPINVKELMQVLTKFIK